MIKTIKWLLNKKVIEEELDRQDRKIDLQKTEIAKLKARVQEIELADEQNKHYLETISDLRKKLRFLNKREKKLQTIEMLYANQPVDLKELNDLIMEVK